jgi:hypothetical protein
VVLDELHLMLRITGKTSGLSKMSFMHALYCVCNDKITNLKQTIAVNMDYRIFTCPRQALSYAIPVQQYLYKVGKSKFMWDASCLPTSEVLSFIIGNSIFANLV